MLPPCGHRLQVRDTLKRKEVQSAYFSSLEVVDGLQVQRVFLLRAVCRKGMMLKTSCMGGVPPVAQCRGQNCGDIKGEDFGLVCGQL